MEQQTMDTELEITPASPETQWGADAPKGARAVFSRIIKEGANVPLFLGLGQTMINALRDLGYNHTTSAICAEPAGPVMDPIPSGRLQPGGRRVSGRKGQSRAW